MWPAREAWGLHPQRDQAGSHQRSCQQRRVETARPTCPCLVRLWSGLPSACRGTHWETPHPSVAHTYSHTHSHQTSCTLACRHTPHAHTQEHLPAPTKPNWHSPQVHKATFHRVTTGRAGRGTAPPETPLLTPAPCLHSTASTLFGKDAKNRGGGPAQ